MRIIKDRYITSPQELDGDGITASGPDETVVQRCILDFRGVPHAAQDEAIAGVRGARVTVRQSVIIGAIKAMLAGSGDDPQEDAANAAWHIEECVIWACGRRCPEAQDGARVSMVRTWVHGWGAPEAFDVRAFGAWAHHGASITATDCLFTQKKFFRAGLGRTVRDLGNHIGQAVNDEGLRALLRPRNYLPGVCRGLTASAGGRVMASNCYRNRPWITIEGCTSSMAWGTAFVLAQFLGRVCPDVHGILGGSLPELFCAVT